MYNKLNKQQNFKSIQLDAKNAHIISNEIDSVKRLEELGNSNVPLVIPFRDINGKLYVITHGVKTECHNQLQRLTKPKAKLQNWGTTLEFRKYLESEKLVNQSEHVNLICCYGGLVRNPVSANMSVISNTEGLCYIQLDKHPTIKGKYNLLISYT